MTGILDQLYYLLVNGSVLLAVFVVLLLNNKGVRKTRANLFLSILLIAFTFSVLHLRFAGNVLNHFSVQVFSLGDPTFLLIAPLLWFYTQELAGQRIGFKPIILLHFTPFLLIVFCSLYFRTLSADSYFIVFLRGIPRLTITLFWLILVIQFSTYLFFIRQKWTKYQQLIKEEVSNTENLNISWIRFFMTVFLVITLFFFLFLVIVIHSSNIAWLWKAAGIIFSLSIFALGYKGILQREIFNTIEIEKPEKIIEPITTVNQKKVEELIHFMNESKPFLNAELTLSSLAKEVNMSRTELSQLINNGLNENFYDFVNKYRVEEVKRLMTDPSMNHFSLLGIALEAGFKSKSTFNLIFKRFTGLTPTEYKRNITG